MKVYEFKSSTCIITLETTTPKDEDYYKGNYRVTHKSKEGDIWVQRYFYCLEMANLLYLKLIKDWVL